MSTVIQKTIDDGVKEIQLNNTYGQTICKVHFRPADFSILDRYNAFVNALPEIVKPLEEIDIEANGEASFEDGWKVIKEAEAEIIRRFGELFDMDDAGAIFEKRNAFSSVNGSFFCENVLLALGDIISEEINKEMKKSQKKMEKYLS